jgi:serine/threonine protein kinase
MLGEHAWSALMARDRVGPYRLLRRLGHGGMAEVHLALAVGASGFEKRVAIKTLLPELEDQGDLLRLLIEEARLGARLSHKNLVGVQELGVSDGVYYVRLDLVEGADLASLMQPGPRDRADPASPARPVLPPPPLALFIVEEVALGLLHMHRHADDSGRPLGLVHRDVNPANVLLSHQGEVKLADFGIAKATRLADLTRGNVRKGTYAYMSPEQVDGRPLTPQSDLFSLGVMLAELCTGRRPFDAATPLETMERIRGGGPPDLSGLSQVGTGVRAIVSDCVAGRPEDRFPDAEVLVGALAEARRALPAVSAPDLSRWVLSRLAATG